ncbi:MAG: substrate-binding domain-containing protein [Tannerella sp.]|jgi:phosphate transport system substrate-binding protein|nr:substrate-binding domain-containing protein [Tannerella sp.]
MKRFTPASLLAVILVCLSGVGKAGADNPPDGLPGLTPDNYPRTDASTSTDPLNRIIACRLLGLSYEWQPYVMGNGIWEVIPDYSQAPEGFFGERVMASQTHNSILNLIDGRVDLILSARKMSDDERAYAQSQGVDLVETPIALDALDFLVNSQNPVRSLTAGQVRDIYLGNITNWNRVGGADETIKPFIRNAQSGSQEMMKEIVMNQAGMPDWEAGLTDEIILTMAQVYDEIIKSPNGICFTPHYYKEYIIRDAVGSGQTKSIAIDGVDPDAASIRDRTYPFVAPVYVSVRADLDRGTTAWQVREWLLTPAGREVIAESGYVPFHDAEEGNETVEGDALRLYPNPMTEGFYVTGLAHPARLTLIDAAGRRLLAQEVENNAYIPAQSWPAGLYIAVLSDGKTRRAVKLLKK